MPPQPLFEKLKIFEKKCSDLGKSVLIVLIYRVFIQNAYVIVSRSQNSENSPLRNLIFLRCKLSIYPNSLISKKKSSALKNP